MRISLSINALSATLHCFPFHLPIPFAAPTPEVRNVAGEGGNRHLATLEVRNVAGATTRQRMCRAPNSPAQPLTCL